ncbi:MAG: sulfite exporter TauE/SafE family protein [Oscillospiraceae bacterium]|jgi:sulfite exporter TauE/SafE/copper chaperone CopZ/plastocyanin domain-containing protein|nr:sulfite exporter TauE/SafE family protein [Oscillospiraceae bacterium]
MDSKVKTKRLEIGGMTCISCQNKIERKLRNTAGVKNVKVSYSAGTVDISYDTDLISPRDITAVIERLDYHVLTGSAKQEAKLSRVVGILVIVVSLYVLLQQFGVLNLLVPSQLADTKTGYGMLFVIGLMTSIHCIAMCGGINLSQCMPYKDIPAEKKNRFSTFRPTFLYNLGRVISYTVIGGILGFAGLLFSGGSDAGLPIMAQGLLKLVAGAFMVIMGINMLGIFPWLRKFQPHMPKILAGKLSTEKARSKSPLIVGLLNGLMPCGPLQSMQIVALASGNPLAGALSMFLFSMGTVPLMFGFGSVVSVLGKKFTQKVMSAGAVLVVVLGLAMLSQGGALSGFLFPDTLFAIILGLCAVGIVSSIPFKKPGHKTVSALAAFGLALVMIAAWNARAVGGGASPDDNGGIQVVDGKQIVNSTLSAGSYPNIAVEIGTPVKWTINAPSGSINGCNNRINIGEYGITNYALIQGDNVIEFTPTETGRFQYSCWMGMIRGSITVTEAGTAPVDSGAGNGDTGDGYTENDYADNGAALSAPAPAGVTIPTDKAAVSELTTDAEYGGDIQVVDIELTDQGFSPAIVVVQAGLDVKWHIRNSASGAESGTQLLVPNFAAQLLLEKGENTLYFFPTEDFEFSTGDNKFYGYVKVTDSLAGVDIEAVKAEVGRFEPLIYPPEAFQAAGGASCH